MPATQVVQQTGSAGPRGSLRGTRSHTFAVPNDFQFRNLRVRLDSPWPLGGASTSVATRPSYGATGSITIPVTWWHLPFCTVRYTVEVAFEEIPPPPTPRPPSPLGIRLWDPNTLRGTVLEVGDSVPLTLEVTAPPAPLTTSVTVSLEELHDATGSVSPSGVLPATTFPAGQKTTIVLTLSATGLPPPPPPGSAAVITGRQPGLVVRAVATAGPYREVASAGASVYPPAP
ncbi:MAG TPA: hypothetical protein VF519_12410 [Mycobacteriales bacterium]|jgi:hypothetical protein